MEIRLKLYKYDSVDDQVYYGILRFGAVTTKANFDLN